jgi:predicted GNAT superfamily acetyltransferase
VSEIHFREAETISDYEQCVEIQIRIWDMAVPAVEVMTTHRCGGVCIGAFDGDTMIGFVCGIIGRKDARIFHHSNMLAVVPEYRSHRIGEKLKWKQRDRVLAQGLDLITWTFDPLQAPNANLNINRLGVEIHQYYIDYYGNTGSRLHGGLPTDRFEVEWNLESRRVHQAREGNALVRPDWETLPRVNITSGETGSLRCDTIAFDRDDDELLIEVPPVITPIMEGDPDLALDWRLKTRQIFQTYFGRGYAIDGFHRAEGRVFYCIMK